MTNQRLIVNPLQPSGYHTYQRV